MTKQEKKRQSNKELHHKSTQILLFKIYLYCNLKYLLDTMGNSKILLVLSQTVLKNATL